MKFTDEDGEVWEWRGEYRKPALHEYILGHFGEVYKVQLKDMKGIRRILADECQESWIGIRAIIHPVFTIHEFGGVKFEETGKEYPREGDWLLSTTRHFAFWFYPGRFMTSGKYIILRPLQGE